MDKSYMQHSSHFLVYPVNPIFHKYKFKFKPFSFWIIEIDLDGLSSRLFMRTTTPNITSMIKNQNQSHPTQVAMDHRVVQEDFT